MAKRSLTQALNEVDGKPGKVEKVEVENICDLKAPMSNTTVHGAVTSISPIKKGKTSGKPYYDGRLADDSASIRLAGFSTSHRKKLEEFHQRRVPAMITNCQVQRSIFTNNIDILLTNESLILESNRGDSIDAAALIAETNEVQSDITLDMLQGCEVYSKVNVVVKAVHVEEPTRPVVKLKQDIIIADATGTGRLTLWEDQIPWLNEGRSYKLVNLVVRTYLQQKYLSKGENSEMEVINDIGQVAIAEICEEEITTLSNVTIIAVPELIHYKQCIKCRSPVEPLTPPKCKCSNLECRMVQKYDFCATQLTAKVMIMAEGKIQQVQFYGERLLRKLINDDTEISQESLLKVPDVPTMKISASRKIVKDIILD